jgi:Arc/MetJ-type ribon-helix-helix transcriptional regulator
VSLPDEQVAAIKRAVASGRARTVSAFISEAVEQAQK